MRNHSIPLVNQILIFFIVQLGLLGCSQSVEDVEDIAETPFSLASSEDSPDQEEQLKSSTSISSSLVASSFSTEKEKWVSRRILVLPNAGVDDSQVASILSAHGGKTVGKITSINIHIVELPLNANEKAIAALLEHHPKLKFAEVDTIVAPQGVANDYYYANAWHLPKIQAPQAWDVALGDGVTIAICDTGVNGAHPDLINKMVPGYNTYDNNTDSKDVHGHGTAVAGTAAASSNNSIGVTGVAWNAKIMPIRVTDLTGYATWSTVASAITWAADHGARIASISFLNLAEGASVLSAANYMQSKGGCSVMCMGNSGTQNTVVNAQSEIFVTATDSSDSYTSWTTFGSSADVSAPGYGIYSTSSTGGYGSYWGTSFSTPIVAGVVALMMSANPNLPGQQIQSLLYQNADDLGALGWDQYYGHGRVNAARAVAAAKNAIVQDLIKPTVSFISPSAGAKVSGNFNINVSASDNVSVTKVYIYAAGNLVASLTSAPYTFSLNTLNYADGSLSLMANAYDGAGNIGTTTISVTVANTVDTTAPVVTISKPSSGATVSGNVSIVASATDNKSVVSMSVIIDGVTKANSSTGSISYNWNTRKVKSGVHTIQVNAVDAAGNIGTKIIQVTK